MTFDEFATAYEITLTSVFVRYVPAEGAKDKRAHFEWSCALRMGDRTYSFPYTCGIGHAAPGPGYAPRVQVDSALHRAHPKAYNFIRPTPPNLASTLDSLRGDCECTDPFEEWASNLGYDSDSRAAETIYHACRAVRGEMRRLLGAEAFEVFLECDDE